MRNKPLLRWALMNVSLVLLPLLIVITGLYYVASLQRVNRLRAFETDAAELLESMRYYAATEKFMGRIFFRAITTAASAARISDSDVVMPPRANLCSG